MAYPGAKIADGSGARGPPESDLVFASKPQRWHIPEPAKKMWRYQESLPRLPVPELEHTLAMYLKSVQPLCDAQQWEKTRNAVADFLTSPKSTELQQRLQKRAAAKGNSSWLIDWWNELSYFGYRESVVVNVSYFYQFHSDNYSSGNPLIRAAGLVKAALEFKELVATDRLEPEMSGKKPQDMSMYRYLFNAIRVPYEGKDFYETFDMKSHNHIIVIRKGRMFSVEVSRKMSIADVSALLQSVVTQANKGSKGDMGILTSDHRDRWAAAYKELSKDTVSEESLRQIGSSSFVVCLDEEKVSTAVEKARNCWHGNGTNRWFDKPLQFIVCDNNEAGFIGEHGIMDGQPTNRCVDWMLSYLAKSGQSLVSAKGTNAPLQTPVELSWNVNNSISQSIDKAHHAFADLIDSQVMEVLDWTQFGKDGLKKLKVSPDAFVQMSLQLAYYRIHNKFPATYEACSTRSYLHGRTETIRSCHTPGADFCRAMNDSGVSAQQTYGLLQKAAAHQSAYARKATQAMGCDRHLLGLKLCLKSGEEVPEIFSDPMFSYSSSWVLSTSALASEHFASWGFGEVVPNGYGVGYLVNKNNVAFTISTLKTHSFPAAVFKKELKQAITEMYAMCQKALSSPVAKL
eukprot:TRINITY_DN1850_c2_g1_i1.p1 TRINITY_DN1850_c2_g1~~TRINITY_DN1850_c2_g1_i1.p1  ORF type:complete len:646 (+),score=126.77 TRINITY_DN1850_c2_g1_i1:57-1940(+)